MTVPTTPKAYLSPPRTANDCDENRREHDMHSRFLPIGFHMIAIRQSNVNGRNHNYR
jgi:hypothetical protein